jgi:hypothetical protein
MSDEDSDSQAPQDGTIWWWDGEQYQPIPPELLDPETSEVALAISEDEYPDLAELVIYANNVDSYLERLGIEDPGESGESMGTGQGSPVGG